MRKLVFGVSATMIFAALFGCDAGGPQITAGAHSMEQDIEFYFPTQSALTTILAVQGENGLTEDLTFQFGAQTTIDDRPARIWIIAPDNGKPDTNYLVSTDEALFLYDTPLSAPEKLLQLPLVAGASWKRFSTQAGEDFVGGSTDTTVQVPLGLRDLLDNGNTGLDDPVWDYAARLYPFAGQNESTVLGTDDLITADGTYYPGALKVVTVGYGDNRNYFWFVPGIGLAKYVINATLLDPDGTSHGEIIYFQR